MRAVLVAWQNVQQPFVVSTAGGPNPSVAAVLGIIPGVGAMYNGQYFKGLIHVVIFVVIISITTHYGLFGLFIPAWILYQSFEAFHTAKAIRDGQPMPDPLGLNEVGNWLNLGGPQHRPGMPFSSVRRDPAVPGLDLPRLIRAVQAAISRFRTRSTRRPTHRRRRRICGSGGAPVPPVPPVFWRRKEPIGALILIGFGLLLLLNQMGFLAEHV